MSMIEMKKLTVLSPTQNADALVRKLMKLRCVELRTVPLDDASSGEADGAATLLRLDCDTARAEAERRVKDTEEAILVLDHYTEKQKPMRRPSVGAGAEAFPLTGSVEKAREVVCETVRLRDQLNEYRAEDTRLRARLASLRPWLSYDLPLGTQGTDRCEVWLGVLPAKTLISTVADALQAIEAGVEEVFRDESGMYVSVVFLKEAREEVNRALSPLGFLRSELYTGDAEGTAAQVYRQTEALRGQLGGRISAGQARLRDLATVVPDVERLYDVEMTTLIAAREKQKLATTQVCVLLEGWMPVSRLERVTGALDKLDCAYEVEDPAEGDEPPVLLRNNRYASNFEWVVGMYSYPKYGTYDPTFIMSIFYFVIFGLMFADVGYGAILVLAGFLGPKLLHMKKDMTRMLNMFGYCGIACVLLGFVFGGWFGDMPYAVMVNMLGAYDSVEAAKAAVPIFNGLVVTLGGSPISLNPLEEPMAFLVISLIMGAIHLIGAMIVKFVLLCKEGKVADAIFDIASWWLIFIGIGLFVAVEPALVGGIVLGVGVLMIVAFGGRATKNPILRFFMGLKGLYDIVSYASDLLSYCRILALGLAAGVIAQVVNLIATMGGPSVGGFIVMVLVFLIGHVLNMAINLLGAFVHTSRLQYLEFFNKFFVDGGQPFEPATPSEKYTVDPSGTDES